MSDLEIRRISAAETIPIRWPVLRAGFPRETAIFPGDDLLTARHHGVFCQGALMGVASWYPVPLAGREELRPAWQLRGMAILPQWQKIGAGRELLVGVIEAAKEEAGGEVENAILWCNARVTAADFYRRHRFDVIGEQFEIPTVGPHFRMWRYLLLR